MDALGGLAPSLLTAARGVIAAFGALCLLVHVLWPCAVAAGSFLFYEVPHEAAQWQLQWAQEAELRQLEERLTLLKKRQRQRALRTLRNEKNQLSSDKQETDATIRRRDSHMERAIKPVESAHSDGESVRSSITQSRPAQEEDKPREHMAKPSRRPTRPLQVLSPNVPLDRPIKTKSGSDKTRPVPTYLKASVGVTKPHQHSRHDAVASKSRVLSLGNIFDEADSENAAPVATAWAQ